MNELKTINEWNKKSIGELFMMYVKSAWYFETWWEKLILVLHTS